MEDYQKRAVEEKKELDAKVVSLTAFLFSEKSNPVPEDEKQRMQQQVYLMMDYSRILGKRISNF